MSNRPVSTEDLTKVFAAAAVAVSSSDEQPRSQLRRNLREDLRLMVEANRDWAKHLPLLLLSVGKSSRLSGCVHQ